MALYDRNCRRCPRLATFLDQVADEHPSYHARPVASFGVDRPPLLVVGLAPGMHGANRTGRPFTGDHAGILLYETLHEFGFSSAATSKHRRDGLKLIDCRITNAVKCLPPANKPIGSEINNCNVYLQRELGRLPTGAVALALGRIAHDAILKALGLRKSEFVFGHRHRHALDANRWLVDSYHCSRYNTQTRRLTPTMFKAVFKDVRTLIDG